ncbi:MAG: tetratricopeptide repeat protein [bacterium]|nr:tetratricopeptide repeat protein [bacterium]
MSYSADNTGNNGMYQDMVDLHNATARTRSETVPTSPPPVFSAAKMAKMGVFAEKPLTQPAAVPHNTEAKPAAAKKSKDSEKRTEPSNFYDWLFESYKRMEKGDPSGAWQAALKTLEYDTTEPDLFVPLCQQFEPAKRRQLAHSAMQKTPGDSDAYQYLWVEVALSYWYEGNFKEACAEYETILKQKYLDPCLIPMLYNSLSMCYEALGRYKEAEQKYLEIDNRESVIKARARSGDIEGAVELMRKGMALSEPAVSNALEETLLCCLGRPTENIALRIAELLELDSDWPYKDFMLGIMQLVESKGAVGYQRLERFLRVAKSSEHEWAITLRWEIGVATDVLSGYGA